MLKRKDIVNGVYGLTVGDALGVPVEFMERDEIAQDPVTGMRGYGTHNQPAGTWSDDTSLVLATMDAMDGKLDYNEVMENFVRWLRKAAYTAGGEVFDAGGTTCNAIYRYEAEKDPDACGLNDLYNNGNGSLMRMLPMIYYVLEKHGENPTDEAVREIYRLSGLTHNHIISKVCCVYYVYVGISILTKKVTATLRECIKEGLDAVNEYYAPDGELPPEDDPAVIKEETSRIKAAMNLPMNEIRASTYVVDSLEASIWCLCNTSSYREAVLTAVNLGLDTDTVGAITGSLAGIYYGRIPVRWILTLRNKRLINNICNEFYRKIGKY
jgi:ADP-ribosylglycohydrolase